MPRSLPQEVGGVNVAAVLDTLAWSEIGPRLLLKSDDGYNVFVGSTAENPNLASSYADHPMKKVTWIDSKTNKVKEGSAFGRYQILSRYWPYYKKLLKLPDCSPQSQDKYGVQQFKEQKAFELFKAGKFVEGIQKISNIWASLPGAGYDQHEHKMDDLIAVYKSKGGVLA